MACRSENQWKNQRKSRYFERHFAMRHPDFSLPSPIHEYDSYGFVSPHYLDALRRVCPLTDSPLIWQQQRLSLLMEKTEFAQNDHQPNRSPTSIVRPHLYQILDAPRLNKDSSSHHLVWSFRNQIAVALEDRVAMKRLDQQCRLNEEEKLVDIPTSSTTSLDFSSDGNQLALGRFDGWIDIRDTATTQTVRLIRHRQQNNNRVCPSSLSWNQFLSVGNGDGSIWNWDHRCPRPISVFRGHQQGIAALKWSPDGQQLVSGGMDDHKIVVWSLEGHRLFTHQFPHSDSNRPVQGLAWSPLSPGILASSGGDSPIGGGGIFGDFCFPRLDLWISFCQKKGGTDRDWLHVWNVNGCFHENHTDAGWKQGLFLSGQSSPSSSPHLVFSLKTQSTV